MKFLFWLCLSVTFFVSFTGCGPSSGSAQLPFTEEPSGDEDEPEAKPREQGDS